MHWEVRVECSVQGPINTRPVNDLYSIDNTASGQQQYTGMKVVPVQTGTFRALDLCPEVASPEGHVTVRNHP